MPFIFVWFKQSKSGRSDEIKYLLVENLGRGITIYKVERGYLPGKFEEHSPCDLIFTVITRLELRRLKNLVHEINPKAFVFVNSIKETAGGILKRVSGQRIRLIHRFITKYECYENALFFTCQYTSCIMQ
jgi:uncharacterized membrane-anchored protein YitT (DUF2179 family)